MSTNAATGVSIGMLIYLVICLFLYPFSRFVYEGVVGFIMGNNVFIVNAMLMLITKLFTMLLCFFLSIIIAPIGLIFLYFYHSSAEKKINKE